MKNKKIIYLVLILILFLILNPSNVFAATHVTVKNHNNENVFLTLPDTLDSFKYIVIIEHYRDTSVSYKVYFSTEPFSISTSQGNSYFFQSTNGAYYTTYNYLTSENFSLDSLTLDKQHTSTSLNGYQNLVIFSTFTIADSEGNVIIPKGEYGVDYSNSNNSEDFYEGNSSSIITETNSINTSETENSINNAIDNIAGKFTFTTTITNNVNGLIDFITSIEPSPTLTLNVNSKWYTGELKILDLSFYEPYKEAGDLIIVAFAYLLFLWQVFLRLPDTINGIGSTVYSVNSYIESRVNSQLKGGKK